MKQNKLTNVRNLVLIAMLGALSAILMLFKFPLPFAPSFYTVDIGDLPVLIGSFAIGPLAGVIIALVKNIINLVLNGTTTMFVGELANFLNSAALVLPAALIYHRNKTKKSAIMGLVCGVIIATIASCILNVYVTLPLYCNAYGWKLDKIIDMAKAVNGLVTNLNTYVICAVVPFNLVKGGLTSLITIVIYKYVSKYIHSYQNH
ncbi:substrate-specific component RibU of riboflavin ECF transporter [Lachnospiraceae bacterium KM106-2]|nr:substrate-specific component RibU of riboflavin ECF transporter [Lachnospiraceae bacterium KM106-2]